MRRDAVAAPRLRRQANVAPGSPRYGAALNVSPTGSTSDPARPRRVDQQDVALPAVGAPRRRGRRRRPRWQSGQNASTVGPAPDTTAATPSARSASTRASDSGIAGRAVAPGAGSRGWPVSSCSGATAPARRRAARCARRWRRRRACGTVVGQQAPGDLGRQRVGRARTPTATIRGSTGERTAYTSPSSSRPEIDEAAVAAPGATLSGWPSSSAASRKQRVVVEPRGAVGDQAAGEREPADDRRRGRAEAAGVRDRRCGRRAAARAAERPARRTPRASRGRRGGTRPAAPRRRPAPVTSTTRPVAAAPRPRARRAASRARPSESKPGPRLAEVAGTETRTGPVDEASSGHGSDQPGGRGRGGDVGVDDVVDERPDALERGRGVLEPVAGHGDDDGAAGVRLAPRRGPAAARRCRPPTRARRRRRRGTRARAGRPGSGRRVTAAKRPPDSSRAASASFHEAGLPIRIAVALVSGSGNGSPVTSGAAPSAWKPRITGSPGGEAEVGVLRVAEPVRRDVAGVADREQVVVGGVAEEVDDLERRGLLALEPDRVDRVDQRDRVVPGELPWPGRGSRRSCRGP